jgi:hypothetical protein
MNYLNNATPKSRRPYNCNGRCINSKIPTQYLPNTIYPSGRQILHRALFIILSAICSQKIICLPLKYVVCYPWAELLGSKLVQTENYTLQHGLSILRIISTSHHIHISNPYLCCSIGKPETRSTT